MSTSCQNIRISANHASWIFGGFLFGAFFFRFYILQELSSTYLNCRWCVFSSIINADLPFLGLLAWLYLTSLVIVNGFFSTLLRLLAMMGFVFYIADVAVMSQFTTRLYIADVITYLAQPSVIWHHLGTFSLSNILLAGTTLMASFALVIYKPGGLISKRILVWRTGTLIGLALIIPYFSPPPTLVHDWAIRNVFISNLPSGLARKYSEETWQRVMNNFQMDMKHEICQPGRNRKRHIVVLILESWSAYHSAYWSGLNDWTPKLDEIARKSISFRNFHSGGPNTMEGMMAIFTGRDFSLPIAEPYTAPPFAMAWGVSNSLPRQMKAQGYHTAFLTSSNLGFTKTREWLKDVGFDHVEGHEYIGYKGIERHHFESVPDDVLYKRVLKYLDDVGIDGPMFLVIETVSTHHPFIHPYTQERSEGAAFKYIDDATSDFIGELGLRQFFKEGILVVLGDHRAMTILPRSESTLLGRGAASHIPAFIVSNEFQNKQVDQIFHQADLMPTLVAEVSDSFCYTGPFRDMLADKDTQPRCMFHARGDHRDFVDVLCANGDGTVKLDGDDSRFVDVVNLTKQEQKLLLDEIAWRRISVQGGEGSP